MDCQWEFETNRLHIVGGSDDKEHTEDKVQDYKWEDGGGKGCGIIRRVGMADGDVK